MDTVTVWHDGCALKTSQPVLDELGLVKGQRIDADTLYRVIAANAASFCADMDLRRARGLSAPDCSELKADLAKIRGARNV